MKEDKTIIFLLCICLYINVALSNDHDQVLTLEMVKTSDINERPFAKMEKLEIEDSDSVRRYPRTLTIEKCEEHRFHPSDIFQRIQKVGHIEDCMVMCHHDHGKCFRIAYSKTLTTCYLFSNTYDVNQIPKGEFQQSSVKMCTIAQYYRRKYKPKKMPVPDDGEALKDDQCGIPAWPFSLANAAHHRPKRIVGGQYPPYYSLPWTVSLRDERFNHFCTGSIVSFGDSDFSSKSQFVLTAAHCLVYLEGTTSIVKRREIYVVAGMYDGRFKEAHEQVEKVTITKPIWESPGNKTHDAALLTVKFKFNNYVRPLCLPRTKNEKIPDTNKCFVAGWGLVTEPKPWEREPKGELCERLLATKVEILPGDPFTVMSDDARRGYSQVYNRTSDPDKIYGAVNKLLPFGRQIDKGNNGAALFCMDNDKTYTIHGIVSNNIAKFGDSYVRVTSIIRPIRGRFVAKNPEHQPLLM